jgi:hypothetical protein
MHLSVHNESGYLFFLSIFFLSFPAAEQFSHGEVVLGKPELVALFVLL